MEYTINNISKQQIDSLCAIQDNDRNKLSQKDDNLNRLFNTIEYTKKNPSCLKTQNNEIGETQELSFEIDYPDVIKKINEIIKLDRLDDQYEIVNKYLKQSTDDLGLESVNDLIEALDFQVLN